MAQSTFNKYDLTLRRLVEFLTKKHHGMTDILFSQIDNDFITDFNDFLRDDYKMKKNSVAKLVNIFKRIMSKAMKNGIIKKDPFVDFNIETEHTDPTFLTDIELARIMTVKLPSDRLTKVRDIFVFCCFTGLSYGDAFTLTDDHIVETSEGLWIEKHRIKTGTQAVIKMLDVPIRIMKKYKGENIGNRVLPVISNAKINDYVKEVLKLSGVDKYVTFHTARHTFATTVTLANSLPISDISKELGHKSVRQTEHYARVLNKSINKSMNELDQKLYEFQNLFQS